MYPHERSLVKQHADRPFALLGVNSDEDREALKAIVKKENIVWRSWWDGGSVDGPIHTRWQVAERPAIYVLDAKGVVRFKAASDEGLDAVVQSLLDELAGN